MKSNILYWVFLSTFTAVFSTYAAGNRIHYNNQDLFLSGANVASVNFAQDIGPGWTDLDTFADIFLDVHDHGGNAMRLWLHTNGEATPEFGDSTVTGPGTDAISDLKAILDLAWEREVGLVLCLWSFNMMEKKYGTALTDRSRALLTDSSFTQSYIDNALVPMVEALKGHPGIIAWEVFNEPEGMSNELGWSTTQHVPMSAIQRFVNRCAGAIHQTDSTALVTNGSKSFKSQTDVDGSTNYYTDSRLIAAGGDSSGTLDFYSVHWYEGDGIALSPFHHSKDYWGLDKPIVVAEFHMKNAFGVPLEHLYDVLYTSGYAGALAWSWTDNVVSQPAQMRAAMQSMWDTHREDVDVHGIGGDWPAVAITVPAANTQFPENAEVTITAEASDSDGSIALVEFFVSDTTKIGEAVAAPYTIVWKAMLPGSYILTAVATDNQGHERTSDPVAIKVGTPPMVRLEAEAATRQGSGMTIRTDPTASNRYYVDMATGTGTLTWKLTGVPTAGNVEIAFGYNLNYNTPKGQYINVNGKRVTELMFDGAMKKWQEKKLSVDLVQGDNTIQMELSWGWMYIDYLAVPSSVIPTTVETPIENPECFALMQNYPNPFNGETKILYVLPKAADVRLEVLDLSGRRMAVLFQARQTEGAHEAVFDSKNLASGIYIFRLRAGTFVDQKRMLLLK